MIPLGMTPVRDTAAEKQISAELETHTTNYNSDLPLTAAMTSKLGHGRLACIAAPRRSRCKISGFIFQC